MLTLPIKKKWFDMILSGEKREEYRETTRYWKKRLMQAHPAARSPEDPDNRNFLVALRNGYRADSPRAIIEVSEITVGPGNPEWGAMPGVNYFILHIAKAVKWDDIKRKGYQGTESRTVIF